MRFERLHPWEHLSHLSCYVSSQAKERMRGTTRVAMPKLFATYATD
jgi:hypothetical protein